MIQNKNLKYWFFINSNKRNVFFTSTVNLCNDKVIKAQIKLFRLLAITLIICEM